MKKINTAPISGTQELKPEVQAIFDKLKDKIVDVYHRHGFLSIETPIIERSEILLAKAGGDTEKQIYKVFKTAETAKEADQALRFDHTVPLARYVVERESELTFPFKVTQIGRNFRGERAQKGRFREFYQCDVDVIGRNVLPLYYDADVISTLLDTFENFKLDTPVLARINNRKILSGLIKEYNLETKAEEIFNIVDHAEKVSTEKTETALIEIGLPVERAEEIMDFIEINGPREEVVEKLRNMGIGNEVFNLGVDELDAVLGVLEADGYSDEVTADMKIVRGLDYYTGTVFEFILPEFKKIGSVCGGGRYENLAGYFTEQKFPGVGGSIGLTRLFYVLNENKLLKSQDEKPIDKVIIPVTGSELPFALKLASKMRSSGEKVTIAMSNKHLSDKLNYASKIAKSAIVLGEDEVKSGVYEIKDFE